jgi:hypothetical protein
MKADEAIRDKNLIAGTVFWNIQALLGQALENPDPGLKIHAQVATAVFLAMFESLGVPLDTPITNYRDFGIALNRISQEMGLLAAGDEVRLVKEPAPGH